MLCLHCVKTWWTWQWSGSWWSTIQHPQSRMQCCAFKQCQFMVNDAGTFCYNFCKFTIYYFNITKNLAQFTMCSPQAVTISLKKQFITNIAGIGMLFLLHAIHNVICECSLFKWQIFHCKLSNVTTFNWWTFYRTFCKNSANETVKEIHWNCKNFAEWFAK